jgi:Na+/H+ antiporter NhaD/arsenite permease-like protein
MLPVFVLLLVLLLIAFRRIGGLRFQIWQVMLLGALAVLVTGQISPLEAFQAVNFDVLFFLAGMFVVGEALARSGLLEQLSCRLFNRAGSVKMLLLFILLAMGLLSALMMNDTLAVIGTPVVLMLAMKNKIPAKALLLALAFAITIGSVMSPIGNPQNLLIALSGGIDNPFVTFARYLAIPSLVNLLIAGAFLYLLYKPAFSQPITVTPVCVLADPELGSIARVSLFLVMLMILAKIALVLFDTSFTLSLLFIALAGALPVILFSRRRLEIVKGIDWPTIVFFAAMFVLMESVWNTGLMQSFNESLKLDAGNVGVIMGLGVTASQLISNVPMVALYLPLLTQAGADTASLMALAAGSTIAGNLTIMGAASNVIIIQNAERLSGDTLTFWEFLRIGLPLTVVNLAVYWLYFELVM